MSTTRQRGKKQPRAGKARALSKDDPPLSGLVDGFDVVTDKRMHARILARACANRLERLGYSLEGLNSIGTRDDNGWPVHAWPPSVDMDSRGRAIATLRAYALHYSAIPLPEPSLWHNAMHKLADAADAEIFDGYRSQRIAKGPRKRPRGPVWRTVEMLIDEGAKDAASVLRKLSDPDEMDRPGSNYPIVICSEFGEDPIRWYPRGSDEGSARESTFAHIRSVVSKIKISVNR